MADNDIKEYNGTSVTFYIRKMTDKLWKEWVMAHSKTREYWRAYYKNWQREARLNLKPYYLIQKLKRQYPEKTRSELWSDATLLIKKKESIRQFREKFNLLEGFNSHFD